MDESQLSAFAVWCAVTGAVMLAAGFAYRAYSGRRRTGA